MTERKLWLTKILTVTLTAALTSLYTLQTVAAEPRMIPIPNAEVKMRPYWVFPRITYYNAVPEQTDSDPFTSACGANILWQVAISRDIFERKPPVWEPPVMPIGPANATPSYGRFAPQRDKLYCGDSIGIWVNDQYLGKFTVWDTTNARFTKTLDILTTGVYSWGRARGHAVLIERGTP